MTIEHYPTLNTQILACIHADSNAPVAALSGLVSGTSLEEKFHNGSQTIGSFEHLDSIVAQTLRSPSLVSKLPINEMETTGKDATTSSHVPYDVRALVLLRAMIAAANADGEIDPVELEQIETNANRLQLPESARTWLRRELKTPRNVYSIASITEHPADAIAAYIVSHLIVDHQNDAEQAFLDELAGALQLTPRMVMEIEQVLHLATR